MRHFGFEGCQLLRQEPILGGQRTSIPETTGQVAQSVSQILHDGDRGSDQGPHP